MENVTDLGLRVVLDGFREYGADIKAWYNDYLPNHWIKQIQKHKVPYLREYRPQFINDIKLLRYEGKLYQANGDRQVYIINNGTRHGIPNLKVFLFFVLTKFKSKYVFFVFFNFIHFL